MVNVLDFHIIWNSIENERKACLVYDFHHYNNVRNSNSQVAFLHATIMRANQSK